MSIQYLQKRKREETKALAEESNAYRSNKTRMIGSAKLLMTERIGKRTTCNKTGKWLGNQKPSTYGNSLVNDKS